jgi:hypothetical protein
MGTIIVEVPKPVIVPTAEAITVRIAISTIYIETLLPLSFLSTSYIKRRTTIQGFLAQRLDKVRPRAVPIFQAKQPGPNLTCFEQDKPNWKSI